VTMPAPTARKPTRFHPFVGRDVPWLLETQACTRPDHPFLIWEPTEGKAESWSYSAFYRRTCRIAAGLHALGIRQGDYVIIHMNNCPEFLFAWHALSKLGAVAVTTNARAVADDLRYFISHCGARVAITQPQFVELLQGAAPELDCLVSTDHDSGKAFEKNLPHGVVPFITLEDGAQEPPKRVADHSVINSVQYTSGTTSRPKGVVWTHALALWGGKVNATQWELTGDDVTLVYLPLFHTNAICYSMLAVLWSGSTMVLVPKFSGSGFWPLALKHQCTWASMVPFVMNVVLKQKIPEGQPFRFWATGYSELPAITKNTGIKSLGLWGMTEIPIAGTISDQHWPEPEMTIGRPSMYLEYKVVREDGTEVEFEETGRLKVRGIPGISMFLEYLNDPDATASAFDEDGFFDTGDLVTPLANGYVAFSDRAKDMLKVGGENVAASEVERVIREFQGVQEVAVVGKPHEMLDEVPVAFVIPSAGASGSLVEDIVQHCRSLLADFKVPREVHLVSELPRATLDKVAKHVLRKWLRADPENAGKPSAVAAGE